MSHSAKKSLSSDSLKTSSDDSAKSLTPQRKHRKLMKDGSSEVWPEAVEKIFVNGLRKYWESPWATYSRGRSRWRNQFLVDYLHSAGIERSKKQVASHIQVLRNMWKGEPEFHLVAGGEELFSETGLLAPLKSEDPDTNFNIPPLTLDENDATSISSPSASSFSPLEYDFEPSILPSPPTNAHQNNFSVHHSASGSAATHHHSQTPPTRVSSENHQQSHSRLNALSSQDRQSTLTSRHMRSSFASPMPMPQTKSETITSEFMPSPSPRHDIRTAQLSSPVNRVSSLSLWAEGMLPFSVQVDSMPFLPQSPPASRASSRIALHLKLYLPSVDDIRSPPTLFGFQGTVSFTSAFSSAQCITCAYVDNVCVSQEMGSFQLVSSDSSGHTATAFLPDSSLSRCRWFDPSLQTCITQEVFVDGVAVAVMIYYLIRKYDATTPCAELTNVRRHHTGERVAPPHPQTVTSPGFSYSIATPNPSPQYLPRFEQPSLACALTPIDKSNNTYVVRPPYVPTSMSF